jgi:coenzyme PQQ precursor peptide PqqA
MALASAGDGEMRWRTPMKWVKPSIEELCIGLEINDYFAAEL